MNALQHAIPYLPKEIKIISDKLGVVNDEVKMVFYNASGPIYTCEVGDKVSIRIAQGMFVDLKLASPKQIASALGVSTSTIHRNRKKYQEGGVKAFIKNTSERAPYKLKDENCADVQKCLDDNLSIRATAKKTGLTEATIRNGLKRGDLKKKDSENKVKSTSERSVEDQSSECGIGVKRHGDRGFARNGLLVEAKPQFEAAEGVENAGVLIALPVLISLGLLDIGKEIYKKLSDGFFGLQSILLILAFMALLRIKTPEQLTGNSPGELGIIIGLDRAPEVRTLRRKIRELGNQGKAREFADLFARRWAGENPDALGFLYIDGHVRVYNSRKYKLPKTFVTKRNLCMPATTDFWINDANTEPLFFITAEANNGMLSMLENEILPEIKKLAGKDSRVTLIFDREGWSPKTFEKWYEMGFDVLTYRKGNSEPWPEICFYEKETKISGKTVKYNLGQRSVKMIDNKKKQKKDFWMREVRRLCDSGHQTSVMTTRQDLDDITIALRMFSRWTQENFFRYMRIEFNIDHLCTYEVELADPNRLVPNPKLKDKKKELAKLKRELNKNLKEYGETVLKSNEVERAEKRKLEKKNMVKKERINELENKCQKLNETIKKMREKVPLKETMDEKDIVRLEKERKILTDTIKMAAYRAETYLFNLLVPQLLARSEDEGRAFLKNVFQTTADIIPDDENEFLIIQFHTMPNQRSNKALKCLCELINQEECIYPGTNLRLLFIPPELHPKLRPCQEP